MRRFRKPFSRFLLSTLCLLLAVPVAAQSLQQDLKTFTETPAVTGYEQALAAEIRSRLKNFSPQTDNLGNLYVTLGRGAPQRLIVAPMDEPGYVVSGITADGYLRVQRLPQLYPPSLFDLLHAAQPVVLHTRNGKWVSGVVAALSVHLQPTRQNAPHGSHPDEMYIDIGAATPAEVRQAGVDLLDPISLDRKLYEMGSSGVTAPGVGDRFGCAALVELLRRIDPAKLRGTLTVAFVAQQWADSRGLNRLLQHLSPDEMIYVGRLLRRGPTVDRRPEPSGLPRQPQQTPGNGPLIGTPDPDAPLAGLALELKQLGDTNRIHAAVDFSAALPRSRYTEGPVLPQRFVHLGIPTRWPSTPAEFIDLNDLDSLARLLQVYVQGSAHTEALVPAKPLAPPPLPDRPQTLPAITEILAKLVETYGVSGHEAAVREAITLLLPPWAKPETDAAGNLLLHLGSVPAGIKTPRIAFIAHMDEIGYVVRSISADGRLQAQIRGGATREFFVGHAVFVQTAVGMRPGVLELPLGWDRPGFEWPRGPQPGEEAATWLVDVGARSAAEAAQLGIKVSDPITVPKKYRRLFGARASARSFDDRVGCTALVAAAWALGPNLHGREVTLIWSTEEEIGLRGALAAAKRLAGEGRTPDYVFAVDTFVSSDSPLESKRFADAPIGKGFVIRAVDNSNITSRELVDRLVRLARANGIAVQYGATGGGNDGAAFLRYGSTNVPIAWPLRYSHSPGEVIDTRDLQALARIIAAIARSW